jgi:hypothetical protein
MLEGVQPFHPKTPEEAVKLMCLEKKRPPFKIKVRSYRFKRVSFGLCLKFLLQIE